METMVQQYKCFLQFSISRMLLNISCRACRQRRQTSSLYLSIYTSTLQYQKQRQHATVFIAYIRVYVYTCSMGNIITKFILTPNEQLCNNNNMCNILIHPTKIAKTIKRHLQCVLYSLIEHTGVSIVPLIFSNLFVQILIELYLG